MDLKSAEYQKHEGLNWNDGLFRSEGLKVLNLQGRKMEQRAGLGSVFCLDSLDLLLGHWCQSVVTGIDSVI